MRLFLPMISKEEAFELVMKNFKDYKLGEEEIASENSEGRVLSRGVWAKRSSPAYLSAAMDGIAVCAESTYSASATTPTVLKKNQDFIYINTGQLLPRGFNAVIKIENVYKCDDNSNEVKILNPVAPWENIRLIGEDITEQELLLPPNHKITAEDICALLSSANLKVYVYKRPKVVIIPTGNEIVSPNKYYDIMKNKTLGNILDKVIDSNSYMLKNMLSSSEACVVIKDIFPDDKEEIKKGLLDAIYKDNCDMVLILAGCSVGDRDVTFEALKEVGRLIFTGVRMMPGKPIILGEVEGRPVFGIPGYSVSAAIGVQEFVKPLLFAWQRLTPPKKNTLRAKLCQKLTSKLGMEEYVRVNVGFIDNEYICVRRRGGAGMITSLCRADGILRIPETSEGISQDSYVEIELLKDKDQIKNNILLFGSHDIILDILKYRLKEKYPRLNLCLINRGMLGGLYSLAIGECHLATGHLLDETYDYNLAFIKKIFKDNDISKIREIVEINLVKRTKGILVQKGNPKNIKSIEDLWRGDVVFINCQHDTDTKVLLDSLLKKENIEYSSPKVHSFEVTSYTDVAVLIKNNIADAGIGIKSLASVFDLDFIELTKQDYNLITFSHRLEDERLQRLLEVIRSCEFKKNIEKFPGYDTKNIGNINEIYI